MLTGNSMFKFALNILANVAGRSNEYFRTHTFTHFPKNTQYSTRAEMLMDSIRVCKAKYKKMQRYNAQNDRKHTFSYVISGTFCYPSQTNDTKHARGENSAKVRNVGSSVENTGE